MNQLTPQIAAMYLGCEVLLNSNIHENATDKITSVNVFGECSGREYEWGLKHMQLVLRPLSSMTEEEAREVSKLWNVSEDAQNIKHLRKRLAEYSCSLGHWMKIQPYLLSKSFDLFGLLEAKLAVELDKPVTQ